MTSGRYLVLFVLMLITSCSNRVLALPRRYPIKEIPSTSPQHTLSSSLIDVVLTQFPPTTTVQNTQPGTKGVSSASGFDG